MLELNFSDSASKVLLSSPPGEHFLSVSLTTLTPVLSESFRPEALDLQVSFQGQMEAPWAVVLAGIQAP